MKNYDYWKDFVMSGRIDDYLNYIACTREESFEEHNTSVNKKEEGGFHAGSNNRVGNGSIGHAGWGL